MERIKKLVFLNGRIYVVDPNYEVPNDQDALSIEKILEESSTFVINYVEGTLLKNRLGVVIEESKEN